jgi:hypothetical protein
MQHPLNMDQGMSASSCQDSGAGEGILHAVTRPHVLSANTPPLPSLTHPSRSGTRI